MTKSKLPTARYAALSDVESLQLEKQKLRARLRKQEANLKVEIDEFVDIFRFFSSFTTFAKQIASAIPFFSNIKLLFKLVGLFTKK